MKQLVSYYPNDLAWATTADQIDEAFASGKLNGRAHYNDDHDDSDDINDGDDGDDNQVDADC